MNETPTLPFGSLYGVVASFHEPEELLAAIRAVRKAGYQKTEAYTPFPVEGVEEALEMKPSRLPLLVFCFGVFGAIAGYGMQYYCSVIAYPLNIGGRPLHSWPAFIPVTFETTILFSALATVFGMLALNGLPAPHHPMFNTPDFDLASRDRFFLCIEATDPKFDVEELRKLLESLHPLSVSVVPR
jgi:hypothetical protein